MSPAGWRSSLRQSRGSITPLILGFALVTMLLITVIVAASRIFLAQRALASAADGAAVAAADSLDEPAYYRRPAGIRALPLRESQVDAAVQQYVESAALAARFDSLEVSPALSPDATTVTVQLSARVKLPFVNAVMTASGDGSWGVQAEGSARTPVGAG
jgi:uncharacterized membrane protein